MAALGLLYNIYAFLLLLENHLNFTYKMYKNIFFYKPNKFVLENFLKSFFIQFLKAAPIGY